MRTETIRCEAGETSGRRWRWPGCTIGWFLRFVSLQYLPL